MPVLGRGMFASLHNVDYRFLWIGTLFVSAAQWMDQIALGWLVLQLTNSPLLLGFVGFCRAIPLLIFSIFGGVMADRMDKRTLLVFTQLEMMLLVLILATRLVTGSVQVWELFVIAFLTGIAQAFNTPARQSLVPTLVGREGLTNAISLNAIAFNTSRLLGPSMAGVLLSLASAAGVFYVEGLFYAAAMITTLLINFPSAMAKVREETVLNNLHDGIRYIMANREITALLLLATIPMLLGMPYQWLMPIFARDILGIGASGLGLLMTAAGTGSLTTVLVLATLGDFKGKGKLQLIAATGFGIMLLFFSLSRDPSLSLALMVGVGATSISFMVMTNTLVQISVSDEFRGRVLGVYLLDQGIIPLGSLVAGGLSSLFGAPFALGLMGTALSLLVLTVSIKFPTVRNLD